MSKETDEYYRQGVMYGFRAGYYSAMHEIEETIHSLKIYESNEEKAERDAYHMKDIIVDEYGSMSYRVSSRRIKKIKKGGEE